MVRKSKKSKKTLSAQVRKKISRTLDARVTTDEEKGLNKTKVAATLLGGAALAGAGIYGLKKYKAGGFAKKGTPKNPIVQIPVKRQVAERSSFQSRVKGSGFFDSVAGKRRKKGQVMPGIKKDDVNAKAVQEPGQLVKTIPVLAERVETYRPGKKTNVRRKGKGSYYVQDSGFIPGNPNFSLAPYKTSDINFGRAKTAEEKQKISKGVKAWWDKQPEKPAKKHILDDEKVLNRYLNQSRDSRITRENAKEVYDAEDKGQRKGYSIGSGIIAPAALYGIGRLAIKKNPETYQQAKAQSAIAINSVMDQVRKGAYSSQLGRVAKLAKEPNQLGVKKGGLGKKARAKKVGVQARILDKGLAGLTKVQVASSNIGITMGAGLDAIGLKTKYKPVTLGDRTTMMPTMGSNLKRNLLPGVTVGLAAGLIGAKIAKERYFKNKNKDKK
jgi:hypothetical protein